VNSSVSACSHWSTDGNESYNFTKGAELIDQLNELYFSRMNLLYGIFSYIQQYSKPFYDKIIDIRPLLTEEIYMYTAFILLRCSNTPEGREAVPLLRQDIG
jgi:hypothetical protein